MSVSLNAASHTRIVPAVVFDIKRPQRMVERSVMVARRSWMVLLSGFFEPFFYLLSIRIGLSALVGDIDDGGRLIPYDQFVAPGLMAASAMNGAVFDSTFNFYYKLKYAKTFDAMLATPLRLGDIVVGEIAWSMVRGGVYAVAFLLVTLASGFVQSWWAVLVIPASLLIGVSFAALGSAITSFMRSWHDFDYVQLVLQPLFLASTTFYALDVYPDWSHWMVRLTPLYHGVTLCRSLMLGDVSWLDLGHVAYFVGMLMIGVYVVKRRLARLLLS
jgi:lipooligosaccharide transport system permease protein